jgi:hypothetical protein
MRLAAQARHQSSPGSDSGTAGHIGSSQEAALSTLVATGHSHIEDWLSRDRQIAARAVIEVLLSQLSISRGISSQPLKIGLHTAYGPVFQPGGGGAGVADWNCALGTPYAGPGYCACAPAA